MIRSFILRIALLSIFLFTGIRGVTGQGVVSLYLKDNPTSYLVANVSSDDPRLADAMDMQADPDKANIWKWLELRQDFEGYVRKAYVTKGLTVQAGAPVYFVPGDEDAFLAILEEGANAEVVEAAGDWVKVSVDASLPVYYESNKPVTAAMPTVEMPVELAPSSFEPESAVVQDDFAIGAPPDIATSSPYPGEPIDRILEGKLAAYKPMFSNPWKKPTYQWEILNRRNKRIAFVDPSNLIADRPMEYYAGQQVSLAGSIYQINKGKDLVIVANQLTAQ
jgi:hypothetical protein